MASRLGLRLTLLFVAPLVCFLSGGNSAVFFVVVSSLAAAGLDQYRQQRKCLPFPIFLLLVYALQLSYCLVASHASMLSGGRAGQPAAAGAGVPAASLVSVPGADDADSHRLRGSSRIETMTIVLAAHNEHQYMKRTLTSIYERTPKEVLKEIIVVDDGSSPPLSTNDAFEEFREVKIIRHEDRRGLIKSKTEGGNAATGDMIMFLDAHVKPDVDWYKPILRHLNQNYKRVVVPMIPILDGKTWEPNNNAVGSKMMFDWTLFFQWFEDGNDLVPCMSGGLFAITREWWHMSGEYDYQMKMWGAENIEQSIRVWLCGGEIYVARDSRVAHVFRPSFPYKINNTEIYLNKVRTVETWFDDWKDHYYKADPVAQQFRSRIGDLTERLALKEKLHCKPFKWYVDKFEHVFKERHMLPEDNFLIRNSASGQCLQHADDREHVEEAGCQKNNKKQRWTLSNGGTGLRNHAVDKCLDANAGVADKEGSEAFLYSCMEGNSQQKFEIANGRVRWTKFCLRGGEGHLRLSSCAGFLQKTGDYTKYHEEFSPL